MHANFVIDESTDSRPAAFALGAAYSAARTVLALFAAATING